MLQTFNSETAISFRCFGCGFVDSRRTTTIADFIRNRKMEKNNRISTLISKRFKEVVDQTPNVFTWLQNIGWVALFKAVQVGVITISTVLCLSAGILRLVVLFFALIFLPFSFYYLFGM